MTRLQEILTKNIRKTRKELQFSQMKLAELCDVSTSFIGEIELGKKFPSAATLQKIADALGLRPFQLFLEEEDWAVFERYKVLTNLSLELKERITEDLNSTIRRYLGGDDKNREQPL